MSAFRAANAQVEAGSLAIASKRAKAGERRERWIEKDGAPRQPTFAFADSPHAGGGEVGSNAYVQRALPLHWAKSKKTVQGLACAADPSRLLKEVAPGTSR
jgi:hypothetical protein